MTITANSGPCLSRYELACGHTMWLTYNHSATSHYRAASLYCHMCGFTRPVDAVFEHDIAGRWAHEELR